MYYVDNVVLSHNLIGDHCKPCFLIFIKTIIEWGDLFPLFVQAPLTLQEPILTLPGNCILTCT